MNGFGNQDKLDNGMRKGSLRWAFRFGSWKPTQEEWTLASRCVQPEEKERIGKFVFKKDGKSAMAGRLLMRKAVEEQLGIPYNKIVFDRTEKGKPYLKNEVTTSFPNFNFNVSHQGQFAVLAAEPEFQVGIDVMQVERPSGINRIAKFFDTMNRQFTYQEWKEIKYPDDDFDQLATFYRFWCLKESYVKAVGVGIGFDLKRIDFRTPSKAVDMKPGIIVSDTQVYIDGVVQKEWVFEETKLDDEHFVAVALNVTSSQCEDSDSGSTRKFSGFTEFTFGELTNSAIPLSEADLQYWMNFNAKDEKPAGRR